MAVSSLKFKFCSAWETGIEKVANAKNQKNDQHKYIQPLHPPDALAVIDKEAKSAPVKFQTFYDPSRFS